MATYTPSEKPLGVNEESASKPVLTNGDDRNLPTHVQPNDSENNLGGALRSIPGNAWARFNGHGRKRVGPLQSIKAVLTASCMFVPIATDVLEVYPDPQT